MKTDNLTITSEFKAVLNHINEGKSLFLTGKAGTGKSTLLHIIRDNLEAKRRNVVVLAPTGVAAINVGGQTIHSFFQLAPGLLEPETLNPWKNEYYENLIRSVQTLIFDEASMMRADMVDSIDFILKQLHGTDKPFGNKQVIFIGDPFQLPPVVAENGERQYLTTHYENEHFFSAKVFDEYEGMFPMIELTTVFRQSDPEFKHALEGLRKGYYDDDTFSIINSRVVDRSFDYTKPKMVYIALKNSKVNAINRKRINELPGEGTTYTAFIEGENLKKTEYPNEYELHLKRNAQVMALVNRMDKGIVNGSIGYVSEMYGSSAIVEFDEHTVEVERYKWEKMSYSFSRSDKKVGRKVKANFHQLWIRPAYAITSHKSQGKSLDSIYVDLQGGIFAPGQLYVALSRAMTLEGLHLKRKIKPSDVKIDKRIEPGMKKRFTSIT